MREARPRRLSNVVFMGMGEPLANYDRVWGAVVRLHGDMGLSARHLTLSTVGLVPGIRRLATETLPGEPGRLAARGQRRTARRAGARSTGATRWTMLARRLRRVRGGQRSPPLHRVGADRRGQRPRQATPSELAAFARPLGAHVNLIPLNPTPGYPVVGSPPATRAALPGPAGGARGERDHPRHEGGRHRCRLRAARRNGAGPGLGLVRCRATGAERAGSLERGHGSHKSVGRRAPLVAVVPPARRRHRRPDQVGLQQVRLRQGGRDDRRRPATARSPPVDARGDGRHPCHRGAGCRTHRSTTRPPGPRLAAGRPSSSASRPCSLCGGAAGPR